MDNTTPDLYGYLPSRRAQSLFSRYQIILLDDKGIHVRYQLANDRYMKAEGGELLTSPIL